MSFTKNDQAVVLNRESLQYLANCIRLVHSLPDLLNDVLPSQTTTYSSYKVTELLNTLNTDLQNYVNNALGNLSHLKKEIVSVAPTDSSADEDTIYLVQDASGGYEQYLKINGVVTSLGSTSAFNNLYTKTESDAKFALLSTLNSLTTAVGGLNDLTTTDKTSIVNAINELKTDLTTHTDDTDIHVTTSDKTKWNEVDNKVNKTDITTTINSSSTDTQVPSAKSVWDNMRNKNTMQPSGTMAKYSTVFDWAVNNAGATCLYEGNNLADCPLKNTWGTLVCIGIKTENGLKVLACSNFNDNIYVRTILKRNGTNKWVEASWQKLCTTSVANVPTTKITLNKGFTGAVNYEVKNGVCYVTFDAFKSEKTGEDLIISGTLLPKPSTGIVTSAIYFDRAETKTGMVYILSNTDNRLKMHCYKANTLGWCTFSYPVVESLNKITTLY